MAGKAKPSALLPEQVVRSDAVPAEAAKPTPAPRPPCPWVASPISSFVGSFLGLGGLFVIENGLRTVHALPDPMLAVGSFAAVATLLYAGARTCIQPRTLRRALAPLTRLAPSPCARALPAIRAAPNAPLGAPKNLFYGHFLSICAAIVSYQAGVLFDWHPDLVVALAPSLAIAVMVQQKVGRPRSLAD
jgi:hypothetical protein